MRSTTRSCARRHRPSVFDQAWELGLGLLALGAAVPTTLLVVRWVERRPAGSLSSVAGRIRWGWLATCVIVAATAYVLLAVVLVAVELPDHVDWPLVLAIGAVTLALVPIQAAGEEYVFRGYLPQAIGAVVRSPWPPAILVSALFGLVHGSIGDQGLWAFLDRFAFGLAAAWLTLRTGGLEAAIAIHAVGNVVGLTGTAAYGELPSLLVGPRSTPRHGRSHSTSPWSAASWRC